MSYRACFKPQLPRFFIDRFTAPGDVVYDPFMGRGTTVIEAALAGRTPAGCDINPLSAMLAQPRLSPPTVEDVARRLATLDLSFAASYPTELEVFYHPDTLREICALREYLLAREANGSLDAVDRWIRMVAVNRLTGHSPGFFSVYTLPPNQAASVGRAGPDQRAAQAGAAAARRSGADRGEDAIAPDRLRRRHARDAAALGESRAAAHPARRTRRRSSRRTP